MDFLYRDCIRNHGVKSTMPTESIPDKTFSVPRGSFSNYFMKIIVFNQSYRSNPATLDIADDMKNRFFMYYLFPPQTIEC